MEGITSIHTNTGVVGGIVAALLLALCLCFCIRRKRKKQADAKPVAAKKQKQPKPQKEKPSAPLFGFMRRGKKTGTGVYVPVRGLGVWTSAVAPLVVEQCAALASVALG